MLVYNRQYSQSSSPLNAVQHITAQLWLHAVKKKQRLAPPASAGRHKQLPLARAGVLHAARHVAKLSCHAPRWGDGVFCR